ncbi:hypothetical protein LTS10_000824 [Elasticomyces elasticus]|nr:hypothetical protein LTS10_000824 [Elasticomyces elasticus]
MDTTKLQLVTLPPELQLQITKDLPLESLLKLRHTCKQLRDIVDSHAVVLGQNLVRQQHLRLERRAQQLDLSGLSLVEALLKHAAWVKSIEPTLPGSMVTLAFAVTYRHANPSLRLACDDLTFLESLLQVRRIRELDPDEINNAIQMLRLPKKEVMAVLEADKVNPFYGLDIVFGSEDDFLYNVNEKWGEEIDEELDCGLPRLKPSRGLEYVNRRGSAMHRLIEAMEFEDDAGQVALMRAKQLEFIDLVPPSKACPGCWARMDLGCIWCDEDDQ